MPSLTLKLDARDLEAFTLDAQPVSIGRAPGNVIVIDHPTVSARHARVFPDGVHYVVEDLKSTNGTYVNRKAIARHRLLEGDEILVGRHTLVFSLAAGEAHGDVPREVQRRADPDPAAWQIPKTEVPSAPLHAASLRIVSGKSERAEYLLTAMTTIIGRTDLAQIKTEGWFTPKLSAAIARKEHGFTVSPMGAAVTVNKRKIAGRHDLRSGDIIEVSGLTLEFKLV